MVYIGGASINEFGQNEGGKAGDQNGKECYIQPFYNHPKGWVIIRAKDKVTREKLAEDMRYACENDNVGYSYWEHCYDLYNECKKYGFDISKVDVPVDTNCAKTVWCCALYAKIWTRDFNTATEVQAFKETGLCDIIDDKAYTSNPNNLLTGDILVTATKGHTVIVTEGVDALEKFNWVCSTNLGGDYEVNGDAHLRMFPTKDSDSITVVPKGDTVYCTGIVAFDNTGKIWHHAMYGTNEGFISDKMMTE